MKDSNRMNLTIPTRNKMKRSIQILAIISLALCSCIKDDNWPTKEENLNNAATQIFSQTVQDAVSMLRFCELFQEYLDAPGEEKILEKYETIRKNVTKKNDGTYEVYDCDSFRPNEIPFNKKGGAITVEKYYYVLTLMCTGEGEWEIRRIIRDGWHWYMPDDVITYTVTYRKISEGPYIGEASANGTVISYNDDTKNYSAKFSTDGGLKYISSNTCTGIFRIETFDASGRSLDEYALRIGEGS